MNKITTFALGLSLLLLSCQETSNNSTTDKKELNTVSDETQTDPISYDFNLVKIEPGEISFEHNCVGEIFDCYFWEDANGENYLIRTLEEEALALTEYDVNFYDQNLHVYHYTGQSNEVKLKRELLDFVKECDFDLIVKHVENPKLVDIDRDNIGEIMFIYRLACTSDVSPSTQKLVVFEDGQKYILRGSTEVFGDGGDYTPGDEFINNAPDELLEEAILYWEANVKEFSDEGYDEE